MDAERLAAQKDVHQKPEAGEQLAGQCGSNFVGDELHLGTWFMRWPCTLGKSERGESRSRLWLKYPVKLGELLNLAAVIYAVGVI